MIDIKKYYEHPVREFNGNPLINYMPYFSRDHLREMMRSHVEYDPSDITHDWELRLSYPQRLLQLYMPQDHQLDWAMSLVALWQRNYMLRNPTRPPVAKQFYDLCDSIVRGKPVSDPNASFLDSPWCAVVIGTPGSGKSATCKALLSVLGPGVFWHSQHGGLFQLLSVRVQAPTSGSGKTLAKEVFIKLRDAARSTGQTFQFMSDKVPDSRTDLEHAITVLAKRLNLGVLVLDELQHLFRGSAGMDEDSMEFLTGVINRLGIPVVMIGTWKAKGLMALEPRLGRRAISPASATFSRMKQGDDWNAFVSLLLTYQYTEKRVPFTQGLSDLLYRHTQGIQDVVVKLIAIAQMEAIASGEEELSLTLVDRVATEHLSVLAPACRKLAGNAREDDPALWDLEPVKFDKYVNELHARLHMQAVKQRKRAVSAASHAETAMAVAASLVTAQAASIGVAEELAANAVEKAPARTASEHVVSILQAATVKGPKPTRSEKRKAEVDREFEKLDDDDLRKIVYLASRRGESAEAALDAKGFICHPLEELTV